MKKKKVYGAHFVVGDEKGDRHFSVSCNLRLKAWQIQQRVGLSELQNRRQEPVLVQLKKKIGKNLL